ncbi:MAG: hypothetical protein ACTSXX_12355 [Candidatus Baldrarchaeia archaeon]
MYYVADRMIDNADKDILNEVIKLALLEKGRRFPIHSLHRWWSRRFSAIYRFLLASYLAKPQEKSFAKEALRNPAIMRDRAKGKVFMEPFAGGGTGLVEAAVAGWTVIGIDVNPVATYISNVALSLVTRGLPKDFEKKAINVLDNAFTRVKNLWTYRDKIIVYIFISRDNKAPTWISVVSKNKKKKKYVLLCPNCYNIFLRSVGRGNSSKIVKCSVCGEKFQITMKGVVKLKGNLPKEAPRWKAYAVELRDPQNPRDKIYVSLLRDNKLSRALDESAKIAKSLARDAVNDLSLEINVEEGLRLRREANIRKFYQLFTYRQLASFLAYINASRELIKTPDELRYFGLALSEAAKSSCLAAKWHPPIGEPVPAVAMKTYWIPPHTVETNPLAHVPGKLLTMGRNTIASALRTQIRAYNYLLENFRGANEIPFEVITDDAVHTNIRTQIDLAVLDPPYMDRIKSYASLSLVHYAALLLFDKNTHVENSLNNDLHLVEERELQYNSEDYEEKFEKILSNIVNNLKADGRIVLMYNHTQVEGWMRILRPFKRNNLYPTAIYWVIGEAPGSLARSRLRGIFLLVFSSSWGESYHSEPNVAVYYCETLLQQYEKEFSIDINKENEAYNALTTALREYV